MFIPPSLLTAAAGALHAWLSADPNTSGHTLHAVPFHRLDTFLDEHPDARTAGALIRRLEAAAEYESADALQRAVWELGRTHPGCVPVCTG